MPEDIYRLCASIAVFRRREDTFEMLLVHKPRKNDAWQLPQGGCEDGEGAKEAAAREIYEEAGLSPEIIGVSDEVYQYDFPKSYRRFRPDNICGQRVEYVLAKVPEDVTVTVDNVEIDDFVWVTKKELPTYLKRKVYRELVGRLYDDGVSLLS